MEWPFKNKLKCQVGGGTLQQWDAILQNVVYTLKEQHFYNVLFPVDWIHWSRNQGMEGEKFSYNMTPNDTLGDPVLPIPALWVLWV